MGYPTKIATCCYCGSRAALVLDRDRHELSCASCGAPLHDMKRFRQERDDDDRPRRASVAHRSKSQKRKKKYKRYDDDDRPQTRYSRRRKGLMRHLIEEAFDVIEDIFD